jgi:hypothetical protein
MCTDIVAFFLSFGGNASACIREVPLFAKYLTLLYQLQTTLNGIR